MGANKFFFSQFRNSGYLLNFNATNQDYILKNTSVSYSGAFRLEIKFSFSEEDNGYAPIFGISSGTISSNRILVSKTNAKTIINIGGSQNLLSRNYPFQFNTEYVYILERDINGVVFVTINNETSVNLGVLNGTLGGSNLDTKIGATAQRYLTGHIYYADLGNEILFKLNEGRGSIVTAENNAQGEIKTNQDINYINNVMWEKI